MMTSDDHSMRLLESSTSGSLCDRASVSVMGAETVTSVTVLKVSYTVLSRIVYATRP